MRFWCYDKFVFMVIVLITLSRIHALVAPFAAGIRRTCTLKLGSSSCSSNAQSWSELLVPVANDASGTPIQYDGGDPTYRMVACNSVILMDGVATELECNTILQACSAKAATYRAVVQANRSIDNNIIRFPCTEALARASINGTAQAEALNEEYQRPGGWPGPVPGEAANAACRSILLRCLNRIDTQLPSIASRLFSRGSSAASTGDSIVNLYLSGKLIWASREPAVNVYGPGGEFKPHTDGHALTVLVPLNSPHHFTGGGTAFWSPDCLKPPKVEPPGLSVIAAAGSALIFSGQLMHAGLPVGSGERAVFVASFSPSR